MSLPPLKGLGPVYEPEDLHVGMLVSVFRDRPRRFTQARIERAHRCIYPRGSGSIDRRSCESSDGGEVTDECELFAGYCTHVRFRNGVRAVVMPYAVQPPNAIELLGKLAENS
jgi:hypothetical protein